MSADCWPNDHERPRSSNRTTCEAGSCSHSTNGVILGSAAANVSSKSSSSSTAAAKTSFIESVLHTAASMLAGLALGMDVRACSAAGRVVDHWPFEADDGDSHHHQYSSSHSHKHHTYHGPSKHVRASLTQNLDAKPLRFTDSPQHRLSRSRRKTRPSPRRKSSSACNNDKSDHFYGTSSSDYYKQTDLSSNTGYRQLSSDRGYRQLSSDRGYRQLSSDRGYRQLSSDRGYRQLSSDRGCGYEYDNSALYAYDNPSANSDVIGSPGGSLSFTRSRYQCGGGNPMFALDPAEMSYYTQQQASVGTTVSSLSLPYVRRTGDYSTYFSHDNQPAVHDALKRPTTLEPGTPSRLRSSLKKSVYGSRQTAVGSSSPSAVSPTNPTPPESLTSDDSSYMSARDSSATSTSTARVRFSPVTLLDLPTQGQHQDSTVPLQASSSPSSRRSSSVTEFIT